MNWYQCWVTHLAGTKQALIAAEGHLRVLGGVPYMPPPGNEVVLSQDGTGEIRSYNRTSFGMVKNYLLDRGFVIVREQWNKEKVDDPS